MVGRDEPFERLLTLADEARTGRGRAVVLSGEPGSGKTALVHATVVELEDFRVIRCRGVESEMELPYSGLHELLLPHMEAVGRLPATQRDALRSAFALVDAEPASMVATAMATLELITQLADEGPVLLVIDDVQWLDAATLPVITFIARRIAHDPVFMLIASRAGEVPDSLEDAGSVELGPITVAATAELAKVRTGKPLSDRAAAALARATGGNPLAVIETVRLMGAGVEHLAADISAPPPPTELIRRGFADRLAGLPETTRSALTVVASSLDDTAETVRAALAALELPAGVLDAAETAGVIVREPGCIVFAHPLLRALVYHERPAAERRRTHAVLASVSADPGIRAWHAATASELPDEPVAADLDRAAAEFERRGGFRAAGRALERAARLSPDAQDRARRLLRAAQVGRRVGSPDWVLPLVDEALAVATDPELVLLLKLERAIIEGHTDAQASNLQERYLALADEAGPVDLELELHALSMAAAEGPLTGSMEASLEAVRRMQACPPSQQEYLAEEVKACIATTLLLSGEDPQLGARLLVETAEHRLTMPTAGHELVIEGLVWIEEFDLAARLATNAIEVARRNDDVHTLLLSLGTQGYLDYRTGRWRSAEAIFQEGVALAETSQADWWVALMTSYLALTRASLGDESALELAAQAEKLTELGGDEMLESYLNTARALLSLGAARPEAALPYLERAAAWSERTGQREPGVLSWPADLVDAYEGVGNREGAVAALDRLRERAQATGRTWALASVARLEGLLAEDGFEPAFERAIELHRQAGVPFDLARAHLSYGRRLRRSRQRARARTELTAALGIFERLGAASWREQAAAELRAVGVAIESEARRDLTAAELTSQESVVADCIAQGLTNKQAAAQLFLTTKTIEWHLRQIYRKLGIQSRVQLAQWVTSR